MKDAIDPDETVVVALGSNLAFQGASPEKILEAELTKFMAWKESLQVIPTIKSLNERMDEIKQKEVEKILAKYPHLDRTALESLAHRFTVSALKINQCLPESQLQREFAMVTFP